MDPDVMMEALRPESFWREVRRVQADGWPSNGDNLKGMEIDFDLYLSRQPELATKFATRLTGDHDQLIVCTCRASTDASLQDATDAFLRAWREGLRYQYFEAHCVLNHDDRTEVLCLTQAASGDMYVTARVVLRPASE